MNRFCQHIEQQNDSKRHHHHNDKNGRHFNGQEIELNQHVDRGDDRMDRKFDKLDDGGTASAERIDEQKYNRPSSEYSITDAVSAEMKLARIFLPESSFDMQLDAAATMKRRYTAQNEQESIDIPHRDSQPIGVLLQSVKGSGTPMTSSQSIGTLGSSPRSTPIPVPMQLGHETTSGTSGRSIVKFKSSKKKKSVISPREEEEEESLDIGISGISASNHSNANLSFQHILPFSPDAPSADAPSLSIGDDTTHSNNAGT